MFGKSDLQAVFAFFSFAKDFDNNAKGIGAVGSPLEVLNHKQVLSTQYFLPLEHGDLHRPIIMLFPVDWHVFTGFIGQVHQLGH